MEVCEEVDQSTPAAVDDRALELLDLPNECLLVMFERLDDMDLIAPAATCTRFNELIKRIVRLKYKRRPFILKNHNDSITPILRWLRQFGPLLPSLQTHIGNALVFDAIGKYCTNLIELDIISWCDESKKSGLQPIVPQLKRLSTYIWNHGQSPWTDAHQLEMMEIVFFRNLWFPIDDNVPRLTTLHLEHADFGDVRVNGFLAKNPQLQHLRLDRCSISMDAFQLLPVFLPQLQTLTVYECNDSITIGNVVDLVETARSLRTIQIVQLNHTFETADINYCNALSKLIDERDGLDVSIDVWKCDLRVSSELFVGFLANFCTIDVFCPYSMEIMGKIVSSPLNFVEGAKSLPFSN